MTRKKQITKKKTTEPKSKPKSDIKSNEFEKAWQDYNTSLNRWKESLTIWQKSTNEALMKYNEACQKALGSDSELLKKVSSSWEKTWEDIGPDYLKQQSELIDKIFKETNLNSMKKFNQQWEKFLQTTGEDAVKAYQDALKMFNKTWNRNI